MTGVSISPQEEKEFALRRKLRVAEDRLMFLTRDYEKLQRESSKTIKDLLQAGRRLGAELFWTRFLSIIGWGLAAAVWLLTTES